MANKTVVDFQVSFLGDGSATTLAISLLTAPVLFISGTNTLPLLASDVASGVTNVSGVFAGTANVSGATYNTLTKTINVTFSPAPVTGRDYIQGTLEF